MAAVGAFPLDGSFIMPALQRVLIQLHTVVKTDRNPGESRDQRLISPAGTKCLVNDKPIGLGMHYTS